MPPEDRSDSTTDTRTLELPDCGSISCGQNRPELLYAVGLSLRERDRSQRRSAGWHVSPESRFELGGVAVVTRLIYIGFSDQILSQNLAMTI